MTGPAVPPEPAGSAAPTGTRRPADPVLAETGPGAPASFGARLAALVVDCLASALVAALVLSFTPRRSDLPGVAGHLPGSWSLIPLALDYLVGAVLTGQTLGMYLARIRLVAVDRPPGVTRVRPLQVLLRTVLLFLLVPAVVFDRQRRGLHDRISGTAVVRA